METRVRSFLVLAVVLVLAVSGCSSNPLDTSESTVSAGVGIDLCYTCHLDTTYPYYNASFATTIQQIFTRWGGSGHSNLETYYSSSVGTTLFGFPDLTYYLDASCTPCHDPNGDSGYVAALSAAGVPGGSSTPRPVVGCEACHGSGDGHLNAFFPVPYPEPDYGRCGQCHDSAFDHNQYHPEADNILEDYSSSRHNRSLEPFSPGVPLAPQCAGCHSDEGARVYTDTDWSDIPGDDPPISDTHPVQCRTCHDAHDPGELHARSTGTGSEEFRLCNRCHLLDDWGGNPGVHFHEGWGDEYLITDTHFGTPGNWPSPFSVNLNSITGYALSASDERVCRNCHNVHSGDVTINRQWAGSAHADTSAAGAWAHYNWTSFGGGSCQRCHTTTGVVAYLTASAQGTTYTPPLSPDPNYRPQMLYCNGCHANNAGGLRDPGAITADYGGAPFTFPDLAGSNVCMACHIGQASGETIRNSSDDFSDKSFVNSHYLTAGGTIFQATGYEYSASYGNYSFYRHDQIGVTETAGIGENGPCVGCHLSSPESHHFLPIERGEDGTITGITSGICDQCHTGQYALTASGLEEEREEFHAALEALEDSMADSSLKPAFYFSSAYPYIYADAGHSIAVTNWASYADTSVNFERTGKPNMGAAFNYNLLEHDPGSYTHNRLYVKLLIFDSIDWLDNNALDGSIDLSLHPEAARYLQGDSDPGNDGAVARPGIY